MKYLTITLILSFISIAVFGVFGMNHGAGHGCIAATLAGGACPETNTASFLAFHLGAFKSFGTATIVLSALAFLILLFSAFGNVFVICAGQTAFKKRNPGIKSDTNFASQRQLVHWLAFHENSPSLI